MENGTKGNKNDGYREVWLYGAEYDIELLFNSGNVTAKIGLAAITILDPWCLSTKSFSGHLETHRQKGR